MKKTPHALTRLFTLLLASLTILSISVAAAGTAGSSSDPLVTLSYLNEKFLPELMTRVDEKLAARTDTASKELRAQVDADIKRLEEKYGSQTSNEGASAGTADSFAVVTMTNGQVLYGAIGCEVMLRVGTASVERMEAGRITDGLPAVFAEEKMASGVGLTTDIFVYSDGTLTNLALDGEDIASRSTYRPVQVYAADINNDGVIELPRAVLMAGYKDAAAHDALYMLDWYAYGLGATPEQVSTTYQSVSDAWSLRIDQSWHDRITAVKSTDGGLSLVSFYEYCGEGQNPIALFNIYCVTGSSREYYAGRSDLIQLGETAQAVYFAKIPDGAQTGTLKMSAEEITARFSLVKQAWNN